MVVSVVALVRVAATPAAISTTAAAATAAVAAGRSALELLVLLSHITKQVLAELLGLYDHVRVGAPGHC
jgi:hypothetical protein